MVGRRYPAQLLCEERAERTRYPVRQCAEIASDPPRAHEQPVHADDGDRRRERRDDQPKGGAGRYEADALGGLVAGHTNGGPDS